MVDIISIGYLHKPVDEPVLKKKNLYRCPTDDKTNSFLLAIWNAWDIKMNQVICYITTKRKVREKNIGPTNWEKLWCLMKDSASEKTWL